MTDIVQRARDIAADTYIRLEMKEPTDHTTFAEWAAHIERFAGWLRDGTYDHRFEVQTALAALRSVAA